MFENSLKNYDLIILEADGKIDNRNNGWGYWIYKKTELLGFKPYLLSLESNSEKLEDLPNIPIIISGGMTAVTSDNLWIKTSKSFIKKEIDNNNRKILGICFGAQLIAESICPGSVSYLNKPELGIVQISLTKNNSSLLNNFPNQFKAFAFHYNQIKTEKFINFSINNEISYPFLQAFQVPNTNFFGVQFHPELDSFSFIDIVETYRDLLLELGQDPDNTIKSIINIPSNQNIIKNFLTII